MRDLGFFTMKMDRSFIEHYKRKEHIGEVARTPAPPPEHQWIVQRLLFNLNKCNDDFLLLQAPTDLYISDKEIRQPDLMIIAKERKNIITEFAVVAPPNIVIEVLSKTSGPLDRNVKWKNYAKYGIAEYWIVDGLEQTIEQYILNGDTYQEANLFKEDQKITTTQFKNLSINLKDIF